MRVFGPIPELLDRLRRHEDGAVALLFALALIPLLGVAGAAMDYSRASSLQTAMQSAADSTALALSRDAPNLSSAELQSLAAATFKSRLGKLNVSNVAVNASYTKSGGSRLTIDASASLSTSFTKMAGFDKIDVAANSEVKWGNTRLRIALVLDTTGSMNSDGKMGAMKTAAKNLLDQLKSAAAGDGDVYASLIPFSKNVNVGASNHNADWIDWTDWESQPAILKNSKPSNWSSIGPGDDCPFTNSSHGFRCTAGPTSTTAVSEIPSSGAYRGYICPSPDSGNKDSSKVGIVYNGCYNSVPVTTTVDSGSDASCGSTPNCSCSGKGKDKLCTATSYQHNWIKNARSTWNGCVTDRGASNGPSEDYDRKVTAPSAGTPASLFPAEQNANCSAPVMALTYNWSSLKNLVDNLYPLGATNQPIGLVWGWQSLVGGGPVPAPPAKDPNYSYNQAIVLMSDGLNTLNRWYGNGSSTNASVDKRMFESATLGTCANVKAAGITIYAVHVNTDGDPKSTLLENCATSKDKFWMVTSASGLGSVFTEIGTELTKLRISN